MMRCLAFVIAAGWATLLPAQTLVIGGARVHTGGPAGTLDDATIVIEDGRIAAVGDDIDAPADAARVDARGKIVTPGLFSPLGRIGLTEVNAVADSVDYVQRGDRFSAAFDVATAFNPRSTLLPVNRIEGITQAAIQPAVAEPDEMGNHSRVLAGLGAVVQLGTAGEPVLKPAAMLVVYLGAEGGEIASGSRARALLEFEAALDEALDYAAHKAEYLSRDRREYALSMADLEALQDVIEGRTPVLAQVERASDIRVLLELAGEYNLRLVVAGGSEAWMVADELAAAGVGVVLSAVNNLPADFDQLNARLDNAALLEEAGVRVAFGGYRQTRNHNARNITQAAGIAVAHGLSWEAALRAITLTPAEFYGVADRVGSIEPGKDANLVLWSDDPLELRSYPDAVWIMGRAMPMQSRQTLLRDRYLRGDDERPPAFRR